MSDTLKTALSFTLLWAIIKLIMYLLGLSEMGFNVGVMTNFLFIILTIVVTLHRKYKKISRSESDTVTDLVAGAKSSLTYVILMTLFSLILYNFIDKDYLSNRTEDRIEIMKDYVYADNNFEELKEMDEHILVETKEEYIEMQSEKIKTNFSIKTIVGFGFSIWIFVSLFSSLVVTLIFRNVLLK